MTEEEIYKELEKSLRYMYKQKEGTRPWMNYIPRIVKLFMEIQILEIDSRNYFK